MTDEPDLLNVLIYAEVLRQHGTAERMLRDDLRLLGVDADEVVRSGSLPTRIGIMLQQTDPSAESIRSTERAAFMPTAMYRGMTLDGELVIDHLWNFPTPRPNRLWFVFYGYERDRMRFAREHSLDQHRVLRADEHELRGRDGWFQEIVDCEIGWWAGNHVADRAIQAVDALNQRHGYRKVDRYGN